MAHMYYDAVPIYYHSKTDIPMENHGNNRNDSVAINNRSVVFSIAPNPTSL